MKGREEELRGMGCSIGFVHAGVRVRATYGRKSDFAWNFLISKGPEKKSNAAIARYERANEIVALYKGARTSATQA